MEVPWKFHGSSMEWGMEVVWRCVKKGRFVHTSKREFNSLNFRPV